jgi:hypothetical protein
LLENRRTTRDGIDWVPGEALAAFLPTVKAFEKLRAAAESGHPSARSLKCPRGHGDSLRLVEAGGAELDVCRECVGVALDPGEPRAVKSLGYGNARRVVDVQDVVDGAEGLVQILTLFD